jgi:hypothetical protein
MDGNYDISSYSDEDCFTILNLNNPSDRELEMTILEFMDKYQEKSKRLYQFFESMYDRFFDDGDDEVEGFEGAERQESGTKTITYADPNSVPLDIPSDGIIPAGYIRVNVGKERKPIYKMKATVTRDSSISVDRQQYENEQRNPEYAAAQTASSSPKGRGVAIEGKRREFDINEVTSVKKDDVQQVTQTDYVKDKFKLNPVKRNTIFKMISVDSQFREDASTTNASSFTMNLSESIDNVISMKLYSVQIPYTWYTINSSFGSNFFYLKGNSPGIDNGDHDIKVEIPSGNYTPSQFADTIQGVFDLYKTGSKDISLGETKISYNGSNAKILFEFDLKKKYNETDYQLYFPTWFSPTVDANKTKSIPSFFGFNHNYYYPYIAYSDQFIPENVSNITIFALRTEDTLDSSANNYFTIYRYIGTSLLQSTRIIDTIRIQFNKSTQSYSRIELEEDINTQLRSNSLLDSLFCRFTRVNLSAISSYFEIAVKLDRTKIEHIDNSKLAIQFPVETSTGSNHIWTGKTSCFEFKQDIIELNEVVSETETVLTNYMIDISANIRIECTKPGYNVEENTRTITVPSSNNPDGYLLSEYTDAINAAIQSMNATTILPGVQNGEFNVPNTKFYINANDYATFDFDIIRIFTQQDYVVDLTSCFLSTSPFSFNSTISDLTNADFTRTIQFSSVQSININSNNNKIVLRPKESSGNKNADPIELRFTTGIYGTLNLLSTQINRDFGNFIDQDSEQIMKGSEISFLNSTVSLLFNIRKILTEKDYKVTFLDKTWKDDLYFDPSYNLINFGIGNKSSISGLTKKVFNNIIPLTLSNNQFAFKPYINGVADPTGANDITFEIEIGDYSRKQLKDKIQTLFNNNPLTAGSTITFVTIGNSEYTNIRMNINKTYTSEDYKLVFYDPISFVTCNVGVVQNVTWDSTIGWILGFHSFTEYSLRDLITTTQDFNLYPNNLYSDLAGVYTNSLSTSKKIAIQGDSALITTLYNYLLVVLDDFIQNHVNAGLITITSLENDIALPTYASRLAFQCDPITGQRVAVSATNSLNTNLSAKQLYAANQILEDKRTKAKSYAAGPYLKDVFALIPLKLTGMTFGQTYMEFGGTLQNQDRKYFGPVRIQKLSVKLMNDKGSIVNLNGANWSFCVICEILNRSEE